MLSIVKGVSRNRNISELGITFRVSTYVNRDSELYCSRPLVGCNLWLLASMYNHSLLHVASLCIWFLRVISNSEKLSIKRTFPITSLPVVSLPKAEHICLHVHSMCCLSVLAQQCGCL